MTRSRHYPELSTVLARVWLALTILALAARVAGSQLPVRSFTIADGLGDNRVHHIIVDSRGLLWISTHGGLSRFDGTSFQSFGVTQGLPFPAINDILEMPDGDFWLGSNGAGVIRFPLSSGRRQSEAFSVGREPTSNRVNRLVRTRDGTIWLGTDGGLFRMTIGAGGKPTFVPVELRLHAHPEATVQVWSMVEDAEGRLWVGTRFGLVSVLPDGRTIWYRIRSGFETDHVVSILYTPEDGLLWIGHESGLTIFKPPSASSNQHEHALDRAHESLSIARSVAGPHRSLLAATVVLPKERDESVHFDGAGTGAPLFMADLVRSGSEGIHVLAIDGVFKFSFSTGRFTAVTDPHFRTARIAAGAEDRAGNLWVATQSGVLRVARHGFMTFGEDDGLGRVVARVLVSRAGEPVAVSEGWRVSRFDGERFHTVRANIPSAARHAGWQMGGQSAIEDRAGDWWFATRGGLVRFPRVRRMEDLATMVPRLYSRHDGLAQDDIWRLFEDSRGDIWAASLIPGREVLTRWDRASDQFQRYSDADGLQAFNSPTSFYEDSRGVLWVTFRDGGIARYENGRFRMLTEANGLPPGGIGFAFADHAGRLWCTNVRMGLYRIDDLNAEHLQPVFVARPEKLDGAVVTRLLEDVFGSIYLVTPQGIMRIDDTTATDSASIAGLYTARDGLVAGEVVGTSRDQEGRLWFSTAQGVSYYQPAPREQSPPPEVRLGGLRIAGVEQPISAAGEQSVAGLELTPGQSQLEIDYFGIGFSSGQSLAFEYRLLGAGDAWSTPRPSRSVLFSNLAPGRYEFEVRAVSSAGERSPRPARAVFRVVPPVWRRWWFVTLATLVGLSGVVGFERYRAGYRREIARARDERLAELERVRQRIAADLHDEIGSSLTQISILSEVAGRYGTDADPGLRHPLSTIATSSRELVDAMSDIVWAINPAKDHLSDVTQRMRRLAADTFTSSDTSFRLELPPPEVEIALGANVRRELFLIFKEAVNNIVKHSGCSEAVIRMAIEGGVLRLELRDNGKGFDPSVPADGHGLTSLRRRASTLGGTLTIDSRPGAGTAIILTLPMPT